MRRILYSCCCKCIFHLIFLPFVLWPSHKLFILGISIFRLEKGTSILTVLFNLNYLCCRFRGASFWASNTSSNELLSGNVHKRIYRYILSPTAIFSCLIIWVSIMRTLNSGLVQQGDQFSIEDNILFDEMQFVCCLGFHDVHCCLLFYILSDNRLKFFFSI